jgi:starch synthase
VGVRIGYDERRAHALHAGADILLHGSRFEPCGLTQIYAMRYGTVPVASRVGGLADTIVDHTFHQNDAPTGFLFDGETVHDVIAGATRAIDAFMRPQQWRTLQRSAMSRGYGWGQAVARFVDLYTGLSDARPAKSALGTTRRVVETVQPAFVEEAAAEAPRVARSA